MERLYNILNQHQKLSVDAKKALDSIAFQVEIKKNGELQSIGSTCKNIYFVKEGLLRVYYYKNEIEVTESFEFENAIVARSSSLFNVTPSRKAIQAIEKSELICINFKKLKQLYDIYPDIERAFRRIFEFAYVDMVKRIENIQFHTAEERYQNIMLNENNILMRVPLKYIASYLGITPVSLSRIRSKYKH